MYDSLLGLIFAGGATEFDDSIGDKVERSLDDGKTFSELPSLPMKVQGACLVTVYHDLGSDQTITNELEI